MRVWHGVIKNLKVTAKIIVKCIQNDGGGGGDDQMPKAYLKVKIVSERVSERVWCSYKVYLKGYSVSGKCT